ncbi:MAG TPA: Tex family protein [Candidatus Heimdallarchaeota archaeon]|nr:Tex family protein [Candidatus Heimdallarchaeota archaeon]
MDIVKQLTSELNLREEQTANTLLLLKEGATIPFIARYRKENTGNLDETQIRTIAKKHRYYRDLEERRETILESIKSQGKLTSELEKKILSITNKTELEDIYLPYRPKKATRASKARDAGLEPLARWIYELRDSHADFEAEASGFINKHKGYGTPGKIIQGACDILAEELSDDAEIRKWLRELASREGSFVSAARKKYASQKTKFQMYYDFREKTDKIASHRTLAMLRGEREKILSLKLEIPEAKALAHLESHFINHPQSAAANILKDVVKDSFERLLLPATETEIRRELRDRAEQEAFRVFAENLRVLLLAPPAGHKPVLGIDPGFRTGCKVVALGLTGKFLEHRIIYPHEPQNKKADAERTILEMIEKHGIELIAVGNGTASRETDIFIRQAISKINEGKRPICVIVSEAGASVYSASKTAGEEFPDFDVTVRGAISIGRRLQDPLSELVKIDPKAIGVGQYQHDVNQADLKSALEEVVESCVNLVGANLNLSSVDLLKYVAGLNQTTASNIVTFREKNGAFASREELKKVPGIGEKSFQQAAGFLRIPDAANPLDNSAVHPERYSLVKEMASDIKMPLETIIGNVDLVREIPKEKFISEDVGLPTIEDILRELEKPGRDPREEFQYAQFSEEIKEITDLESGMVLEGTVTNVTNFGAFVDIGVHQDGLVHISQISDCYVDDPRKFVKVGQIVKVKVLKVDTDLMRIALSLKI